MLIFGGSAAIVVLACLGIFVWLCWDRLMPRRKGLLAQARDQISQLMAYIERLTAENDGLRSASVATESTIATLRGTISRCTANVDWAKKTIVDLEKSIRESVGFDREVTVECNGRPYVFALTGCDLKDDGTYVGFYECPRCGQKKLRVLENGDPVSRLADHIPRDLGQGPVPVRIMQPDRAAATA